MMVGRGAELETLSGLVQKAMGGRPAVVLITGSAGIGKTTVLRRLGGIYENQRLALSCEEPARRFGLADQVVRGLGQKPSWSNEADAFAVGADVVEAIGATRSQGLLLMVDDAQLADHPSIDALVFALRRLSTEPLAAVFAARPVEAETDASTLRPLERLAARPGSLALTLSGLTSQETKELAASLGHPHLGFRALERLREYTLGNPMFLVTLLEDLSDEELIAPEAHHLPAPQRFAEQVREHLARLPERSRALVEAVAVLGEVVAIGAAARVAGLDQPWDLLEPAIEQKLFDPSRPSDPRLRFRHPLVRAVVYQSTPPDRRASLHGRAADLLDGAESLEHRAAASVGHDEDLASALVAFGVGQAAQGETDSALRCFTAAARVGSPRQRPDALVLAAEVMLHNGELAAAERTLDLAGAQSSPKRRLLVRGTLALMRGDPVAAERTLLSAWESSGETGDDPQSDARIATTLGSLYINLGRGDETVAWTERGLALSDWTDSSALPLTMHSLALSVGGRTDEVGRLLEGARPRTIASPIDLRIATGITGLWAGRSGAAYEILAEAETAARELGVTYPLIMALYYASDAAYRLGRWDDAIRHGELAGSLSADAGMGWTMALAHATAVAPLAGRGWWEEATRHLDLAVAASTTMGDTASMLWVSVAEGRLAHARGDMDRLVSALSAMWVHRDDPGAQRPAIQPWLSLYVEGLAGIGRLAEAEEALGHLEAQVTGNSTEGRLVEVQAVRARAALLAGLGNHREVAKLRLLPSGSHEPSANLDDALVRLTRGAALRRVGRRRAAIEDLTGARGILHQLGAEPYLQRVDHELDACGVRTGERDRKRSVTLTPQELAVAKLVAEGLTNREVARQMVIGVKTVEYHLGNIYAKLGIRSRGGIGSAFERG